MEERKKYKCNTCPREFLNMRQLKKHVKVEHDKVVLPVKTFVCCNCDYTHQDDLHVKSVHEIINHVWRMCTFLQHAQYSKKHIKSTHYKGEKRLKCTVCPFATSNLDSFRCHKQRVHGERKKTCVREKCGYITYTRGGLKRHQESHLSMEERKKYKYNTCPREFLNLR